MKVAFNDLPQVVRERFVRLTQARSQDPSVVLWADGGSGIGWNIFGILLAVVMGGGTLNHLIERAQYVAPERDGGTYLFLAGCFFVLVVNVLGIVWRSIWKPPPYREGTYVFPGALVRTDGGHLVIMSTLQMGRPLIVHTRRNGVYVGSRLELSGRAFVFSFGSQASVQSACDKVLNAREAFARAAAAQDHRALAAMDPFYECASTNTWKVQEPAPTAPQAMIVPALAKWGRWVGSLVAATLLTSALFLGFDYGLQDTRDDYAKRNFGTPKKTKKASKKAVDEE